MRSDGAPSHKRPPLPPFAVCWQCRETASCALTVGDDGQVVCLCCHDSRMTTHPLHRCTVCAREPAPAELHHVASRIAYPNFTVRLCLNCHRILYARQYRWRRDGLAERYPLRYLFVGVAGILRLFAERSPAWQAVRPLFTMLLHAVMLALGALTSSALADVGYALTVL